MSKKQLLSMVVKVLKHRKLVETFGHIFHPTIDTAQLWPSNIPDLFPASTTMETLRELNDKRAGNFKDVINEYDIVEHELNPIN
jgi:hypothetical protein